MKGQGKSILATIIGGIFFCLSILPLSAGPPTRPGVNSDQKQRNLLPGLTVSAKLQIIRKYKVAGRTCYDLRPIFTVTNKGPATARAARNGRWIGVYFFLPPPLVSVPDFSLPPEFPTTMLRPGESKTYGFHQDFDISLGVLEWCSDCSKKVAMKVVVDQYNEIAERNEHNNMTVVSFPPRITAHPIILKNKTSSNPASTQLKPKSKGERIKPNSKGARFKRESKPPRLSDHKPVLGQPDLTAHIGFTGESGMQPVYTVYNKGKKRAGNFTVKLFYKPRKPMVGWVCYHSEDVPFLEPGKNRKIALGVLSPIAPKYRIKVDVKNTVYESNEGNNVIEASLPYYVP